MSNGCAGGVGELRGAGRKQKVFVRSLSTLSLRRLSALDLRLKLEAADCRCCWPASRPDRQRSVAS